MQSGCVHRLLRCSSTGRLTLLAHRSYGHVHETSAASALNYLSPPLTVRACQQAAAALLQRR
jgi:hypothetical protein